MCVFEVHGTFSLEISMQCFKRGDKESHEAGAVKKLGLFKLRSALLNPEYRGLAHADRQHRQKIVYGGEFKHGDER
jgi:hypothetical protein